MVLEGGEMSSIPSDEDFARADRMMEESFRNLDTVEKNVILRFKEVCPLHDFTLLPHDENSFEAYVFFEREKDIEECKQSGVSQAIVDFVYEELERAGRGSKSEIDVQFEFDSHENVLENYEGDYFLRLR
jgi:hypothetical protein